MRTRLLPRTTADRLAWSCLAGGALVLVVALAHFWGAHPGYADRFLILVGAAWAAYTLAPAWAGLPVRPRPWLGLPLLVAGIALFSIGYFLLVQVGPKTLLLWWLAVGLLTAVAGLMLTRLGWPWLRAAAFPLVFSVFALPIPLRILNPLQDQLQEVTTTLAGAGLSGLGMSVSREEFVLALPGGKLSIEEACSGVRSITALTALAAFVAFLKGFGPFRGGTLVLLAVPVVAAVNVLRVVLSGLIQESIGPRYIRDDWHEALGFVMVLVGLALVLGIARLIQPREQPVNREALKSEAETGRGGEGETVLLSSSARLPVSLSNRGARLASTLLVLGAIGTAALGLTGRAAEGANLHTAPIADIPLALGSWTGNDRAVPDVVAELLVPDRVVHRYYENNIGDGAVVWVMYWDTGAVMKGYHHPDVCWGNRGFQAADRWVETIPAPGGGSIPVTARAFQQGRTEQTVLYWTQEGRRVWTDADERADQTDMLSSSWHGHRWVDELLGFAPPARQSRLTVVVVVPSIRDRDRRNAAELTRLVATELYRLCPWATPQPPNRAD